MRDPVALEGQIVSEGEAYRDGKTEVELWLDKINAAKAEEKEWRDSARTASEVYEAGANAKSNFNIYHANIETMIPALYNSTPIPDVRRRNDPPAIDQMQFMGMPPEQAQPMMQQMQMQIQQQAKLFSDVAELTERGLTFTVDQYPFDDVIEDMVRDAAVTGRGTVRLRYVPKQDGDTLTQDVSTELVPWNRFIRGPGLAWKDVPFVAFEHDLTKQQIDAIADKPEISKGITFSQARDDGTDFGSEREREQKHKGILKTIKVYEIWDKLAREVLFVSPEYKEAPITREPDPLRLKDFFCTPRPVQFVRRTTSLVPVCPYDVYKPLINEIDTISKRIANLIKQLVVKGGYDPVMAPDFEQLQHAEDGKYVPITASEGFLKNGAKSLEDAVMHWPIEQIVKVVQALYIERDAIKQTIYEVMGIADIMRGQVDPREKATQSKLKAESGSRRLQRSQNEIARVARDLFRMKAEIMHTQFEPEVWSEMTGMQISEPMLQLMRSGMRQFAIDIETDSTVRADQAKYQEEMNVFLQGTAQFGQALAGLAPVMPRLIGPMTKVYTGFARKFNLGKQGEDALEELTEAGQQPPVQPQQEAGPDPQAEAQAKMQEAEHKQQVTERAAQLKSQIDGEAVQRDEFRKDNEHRRKIEIMETEHRINMELKGVDLQAKVQDAHIKQAQAHQQMATAEDERMSDQNERDDLHTKEMERIERESAHEQRMEGMKGEAAEADMARKAQAHEQSMELADKKAKANGAKRPNA